MKERPILFSAPMVRAILAGTKTQTRRTIRIDDTPIVMGDGPNDLVSRQRGIPREATNVRFIGSYLKCDAPRGSNTVSSRVLCPFGAVGDRLWVRETWAIPEGSDSPSEVAYRADIPADAESDERWARRLGRHMAGMAKATWSPSIHMPRAYSRLTLEVTGVHVERLQAITEADALAEGVTVVRDDPFDMTPRDEFRALWERINAERAPWSSNPFVWVISFTRIAPQPQPTKDRTP